MKRWIENALILIAAIAFLAAVTIGAGNLYRIVPGLHCYVANGQEHCSRSDERYNYEAF